ncbi:MAG: AAA family ATPase [Chromatiaceae bacterium]|nr:AAA family ATPase [Chromatiaceae bacterium]MCF7996453.1 AAA family ATPase [Chromatiaceae bacterium]
MIISQLTLTNFRRFSALSVDVHPELTVLVAPNGQGKTTVLDALSILISSFVGAFDMGKAHGFSATDARYSSQTQSPESEQQYPVRIEVAFQIPPVHAQSRELTGPKNRTTSRDVAELVQHGKQMMAQVRRLEPVTLPAIAYYGTSRLWKQHKLLERNKVLSASRSMGYEDCLTSASSYLQLQVWMKSATLAALQEQQMPETYAGQAIGAQIKAIQSTVEGVLKPLGWSHLHYSFSHDELAMHQADSGILPVSLLSDGVRALVSLIADLAWRCVKLNPHLSMAAPAQTPGLVLIDEVDMHLHPAWQQQIIATLRGAFPRIQFIVTTHSPQVLTTVRRECIRLLGFRDRGIAVATEPKAFSYGEPSQDVLQAVMQVDPQPPVPEKALLEELTELVDQGYFRSERACELIEMLKQRINPHHPQIQKIERSIRRQEALQR